MPYAAVIGPLRFSYYSSLHSSLSYFSSLVLYLFASRCLFLRISLPLLLPINVSILTSLFPFIFLFSISAIFPSIPLPIYFQISRSYKIALTTSL